MRLARTLSLGFAALVALARPDLGAALFALCALWPLAMPKLAAVLVNPGVAVPTKDVFRALGLQPGRLRRAAPSRCRSASCVASGACSPKSAAGAKQSAVGLGRLRGSRVAKCRTSCPAAASQRDSSR